VLPTYGARSLQHLTRQDCRELIAGCRAKELKLNTVKGIARAERLIVAGGGGREDLGQSCAPSGSLPATQGGFVALTLQLPTAATREWSGLTAASPCAVAPDRAIYSIGILRNLLLRGSRLPNVAARAG
jgi:hypothetical protein